MAGPVVGASTSGRLVTLGATDIMVYSYGLESLHKSKQRVRPSLVVVVVAAATSSHIRQSSDTRCLQQSEMRLDGGKIYIMTVNSF